MRFGKSVAALSGMLFLVASALGAEEPAAPTPPCDGKAAWPAFPPSLGRPATRLWHEAELASLGWAPPACTGWQPSVRPQLVAALAGQFRHADDAAALLARIGAISSLPELRYWSAGTRRWLAMARDATALASADPQARRPDFSAAEFVPGRELYYWMDDDETGQVVYRMRTLERSRDRVVIASENLTPVHFLFFTLFRPGELRAVEILQRQGPEFWQVYLLSRVDRHWAFLGRQLEVSSLNRLLALYRRLADIPNEEELNALP